MGAPGGVVTLSFVCRLCERDPYQLYQRLEQQAREYVLEMKVRLLRQLSAASKVKAPASPQGPPQAHRFISLLLEEYGALCQAARTVSTFLGTLVRAPSAPRRHPGLAPQEPAQCGSPRLPAPPLPVCRARERECMARGGTAWKLGSSRPRGQRAVRTTVCGDGEQRSGLRCWLVTVVLVDRLVPCGVHGPGGTRPSSAGSGRRPHPAASRCPNEQTDGVPLGLRPPPQGARTGERVGAGASQLVETGQAGVGLTGLSSRVRHRRPVSQQSVASPHRLHLTR